MDTYQIPALFWMFIIGAFTIMLCYILYYIAMIMKETSSTIVEVREVVKSSNVVIVESTDLIKDTKEIVSTVKNSVKELNEKVIQPITEIGTIITSVSGLIGKFIPKK